jgi:glutamate 5-kinase
MTSQISREDGLFLRQTLFDKARRVVVKVGSAVLTSGNCMNQEVFENLADEISFLHRTGREVILVSSGAVAAGMKKIDLADNHVVNLKEKQALAAIGQSCLMQLYDKVFSHHGLNIAQILLTHSDLANRDRYLNVRNTIMTLFKMGVIPIINENDTVSVEELRFGDNDNLGALISNLIEADMFICLTDVVGLYNGNPSDDPDASPIYTVKEVTQEIESMASNIKSSLGTGGMHSKILAAKKVSAGGGSSFIGPGREKKILQQLFSGKMVGTFFLPKSERMQKRKQWIAHVLKPKGSLTLDKGAITAIGTRGKSLLPSGILSVSGTFGIGDAVYCQDQEGTKIAIGLVNYSSEHAQIIKGEKTESIITLLGFKDSNEVIHRDNLVLL